MRYFSTALVNAHPRQHGEWWQELQVVREHFHMEEDRLAEISNRLGFTTNAAAILPRDAWMELDGITRRVMRDDDGDVYMADLMALAKPINIGKLVHLNRVSSDAGRVVRTMSGQVPTTLDKVTYNFNGTPVPIFSSGYGREWREWNTLQSENFDALSDDQEAITAGLKSDNASYVLDGDSSIVFENYPAYGIRTSPLSKSINLGSAVGGANIDLASAATTSDAIDAFFTGPFGAMLDSNLVTAPVNLYVSKEIARNWDRSYSGSGGFKGGRLNEYLATNRRINKIAVTSKVTGNAFFGFVPRSEYIRPLVAMATSTVAMPRLHPRANYQFEVWNAMGIDIRADFNGKSGVFYSVDVD